MAKQNRMHIVALQTTIGNLTTEKLVLTEALDKLGYCHAQQAKFITDSTSGPNGSISQATLFREAKAALAEAIETNKHLTDDAEFQQHRYQLQGERVAQLGRACSVAANNLLEVNAERTALRKRLKIAKLVGLAACVLAIGQALQNAGLFTSFIG